ncbi:hypothetical protein ATN83_p10048 (plasmid) [Raoultella ornithinolytica]|uniref:Uncharacterized protein n=1 Tax=Klebsiella pneumoniae TaxID=573 RepID=A0A2R4NEC2_KLEPN|nr:hypothetical protein ATN83_p10048 [Raoultella ornithinolytica]AVX34489.1 hypothetical protein [Klebsiella pneumoniae]AWF78594.1 hypothetical protein [Klebsiella pneumoniae]QFX76936.1 hypothetical protein [Klebsiella pneumoniae]QFX77159.1 hypothetical protein [Klebsiella pneumoniae]
MSAETDNIGGLVSGVRQSRRAASIRRNSGTGITMQTPTTKTNHNRLQGGK